MKTFVNRATDITMPNEDGTGTQKMGYVHLAVTCMNLPPADGKFSLSLMAERLPVVGKLKTIKESLGASVELEDGDIKKLRIQVDAMASQWTFMHDDIIAFSKYVKDLDEEEVAPLEA